MGLDREQRKVLRELKRRLPRASHKTRRTLLAAAIQTGLVEQNLRHRGGGDADSSGWRQERASIYGRDNMNLGRSIDRFYKEALGQVKQNPRLRSFQIAANVQRPAQQYRGRYRQRYQESLKLMGQAGGSGGSPGRPGRGGRPGQPGIPDSTKTTIIPGVDNSEQRKELKLDYLQNRHDPSALLNLKAGLDEAQDIPTEKKVQRIPGQAGRAGRAGQAGSAGGLGRGGRVKSPDAGRSLGAMLSVAIRQSKAARPYAWGGGHGGTPAKVGTPVDCSGYVSMILGVNPRVSGQFGSWGKPGRGKHVTVYSNSGHVLIRIGKRWFGTSKQNPGGGAGEIRPPSRSYLANFKATHPRGM